MRKTLTLVFGSSFVLTCILAAAPALAASELTIFGAAEHQGQLTLQGSFLNQASATQTITGNLNPQMFGVFGIRYGHGNVIGGEHTFAYAPNFIESDSRALFYHSNLRVQAPFPVITPFAINYGGGVKILPKGPVGVQFDIRGYTLPSVSFNLPVAGQSIKTSNRSLNFFQVGLGIVFKFGE
jgi:hypothetical protein